MHPLCLWPPTVHQHPPTKTRHSIQYHATQPKHVKLWDFSFFPPESKTFLFLCCRFCFSTLAFQVAPPFPLSAERGFSSFSLRVMRGPGPTVTAHYMRTTCTQT